MGSSTTSRLGSLKKPRRGNNHPKKAKLKGPIKSKVSVGKPKKQTAASTGSGLESPFTEKAGDTNAKYGSREYYTTPNYIVDSNTFYVFEYYNLKKMKFLDAKGVEIEFIYRDIPVNKAQVDMTEPQDQI